jgi:hypothetical protein
MTAPAIELRTGTWGTAPPSSALDPQSSLSADRSSREFSVSSFSVVRDTRTLDYYEFQRLLDSIQARLDALKIDYARYHRVPVEELFPRSSAVH